VVGVVVEVILQTHIAVVAGEQAAIEQVLALLVVGQAPRLL
jgi:hypothetical protein